MTVKEAARRLGVTRTNLSRILNGRAGISAGMSVRLAKAMPHTSPEFWLKMQLNYDLWKAQRKRQPKIKPFPARSQKELALAAI
jgi:addiction module HigA family antidote